LMRNGSAMSPARHSTPPHALTQEHISIVQVSAFYQPRLLTIGLKFDSFIFHQ
jgi:hypothetical protein